MPCITLDYGASDPLVLEAAPSAVVRDCRGPDGVVGAAAERLTAQSLDAPGHGPPLAAHVVPGDRVVVAVSGGVPQARHVVDAVVCRLAAAGVGDADIAVLRTAPLDPTTADSGDDVGEPFDSSLESATSYLAADAAARPLYLARALVDADVVVAVGTRSWNAALGGRSLEGELWPQFSRRRCRDDLALAILRRGREALADWRTSAHEVTWQLGVCASLRLVPGRGGSLHAAVFGLPDEAGRRAHAEAEGWRPAVAAPVDVTIASLTAPDAPFGAVVRAAAAAARVTRPSGTICVACRCAAAPGVVMLRWRQGAPLQPLLREAAASHDPALVTDALQTRLLARALGERRLVLLSNLDEATVEDLGFGHAATPEAVERLAHRAESLAVLHEADMMLPRVRAAE